MTPMTDKFTVVIPTMFEPDFFEHTLERLNEEETVGEIILIDNSESVKSQVFPSKVKHFRSKQNLYVNPSWNLGYKHAEYDKLAILNDDIYFDFEDLRKVIELVNEDTGMIGLHQACYNNDEKPFQTMKARILTFGYACAFFIHRSNYSIIPDDLKIFHGDNWLFNMTKKQNYALSGIKIYGTMETTSKLSKWDNVKRNDYKLWEGKYKHESLS